jgi:transposase
MDLRWRIVRACERGTQSQREVAEAFEVSLATVENLLRRYRQTGDVAPQARRVQTPALLDATDREQLRHWVQEQLEVTLGELRERLVKSRDVAATSPC